MPFSAAGLFIPNNQTRKGPRTMFRKPSRRLVGLCCLAVCLAGSSWLIAALHSSAATDDPPAAKTAPARPKPVYRGVVIEGVPHVRQRPDFCGEACAEMYLAKLKSRIDQDEVFNLSGLDPLEGRGCYARELRIALERIGFQTGPSWYQAASANAAKDMEALFKAMHADLLAGVPSIICMHYDDKPKANEHFRLILGYDNKTDEVIYHEPGERRGAYRRMTREKLIKLWPLKYREDQWTVVRFRLAAQRIRASVATTGFTDADYAQHIMQLKKKLPEGFHVVLQKPFVVVGDESAAMVRYRAQRTVKWAVDRLKQDYFTKDPEHILTIWLFKDKESYKKHTKEIFNDEPDTPYGYFSHRNRALIMNIATGGGTLVHEIVHPFVASNFPECPSWFNEGLGSLYEQSNERRGHIIGMTNWRLPGLQKAINDEERELPSFKELCGATSNEFYNHDKGANYAQARYLCYYLQERGLLVKYYHQFRRNVKDDPTGYKTLVAILNEDDMEAFQKRWEAYVLRLRFR